MLNSQRFEPLNISTNSWDTFDPKLFVLSKSLNLENFYSKKFSAVIGEGGGQPPSWITGGGAGPPSSCVPETHESLHPFEA